MTLLSWWSVRGSDSQGLQPGPGVLHRVLHAGPADRGNTNPVLSYVAAQLIGCTLGVLLAHVMFELPVVQISTHARGGAALFLSEVVATYGLLLVVLSGVKERDAPWLVAAWIGAAYWFTASTSFANPAITVARSLTDSFAGIRPSDVPAFLIAQCLGALLAFGVGRLLFDPTENVSYDQCRDQSAGTDMASPLRSGTPGELRS